MICKGMGCIAYMPVNGDLIGPGYKGGTAWLGLFVYIITSQRYARNNNKHLSENSR